MFNTNTELRSFVAKFHQLRRAGFEAHLNLHARGGRYWVGLCAQLGEAEQQPHHLPHQQRPRLRRSPAYARRQERRRAAREAAAEQDPASDVQAAEAKMDEDEEPENTSSTEIVESPPPPQIVSESEAEAPNWFKEHLQPDNKLHGNTKVVVSDQLLSILRPGHEAQKGEKFSLAQIVKSLWSYISERGGYSPGSDYFIPDENLAKVFGSDRVAFSAVKKKFQHHVYHGGKSIYTGYEIRGWQCQYFDISFDNLSL